MAEKTPPPLFPVELSQEDNKALKDAVERISAPIFSKALEEMKKTPLVAGGSGVSKGRVIYLQPHNYRRYFDFDKSTFQFFLEDNPEIGNEGQGFLFPLEARPINNGHEFYFKFKDYEIKVKKRQIEILNLVEHKKVFSVDTSLSIDEQRRKVFNMEAEKTRQCLGFLRAFIGKYGGKSKGQLMGISGKPVEIKLFDERVAALLPLKQRWHQEVGKKDYKEKTFEYYDSFYVANTLRNLAINDVAPAIAAELQGIKKGLEMERKRASMQELEARLAQPLFNLDGSSISLGDFLARRKVTKDQILEIWQEVAP